MKSIFTLPKQIVLLLLICSGFAASSQSLVEDFNYTAGSTLNSLGYTNNSGLGTNNLTVTAPSLSYPGSPSSGVGNSVTMTTSGDDEQKAISPTLNSGSVYGSFIISVTAAQATGDYFFTLCTGTAYSVRVYAKSSGAGYVLGISKSSGTITYDATVRAFNTPTLVVAKYTFNTGSTTDDLVSLYINPALGGTEPTANIVPQGAGTTDAAVIDRIGLRQGAAGSAASLVIDGIRVGSTWAIVTPVATPTTTAITPTNTNAGSPGFTLTVDGTNFTAASVVAWNGSDRTTTFVNSTQLTAAIPATDVATAGSASVAVTTPGAAAASNAQTFTINAVSGGTFTLTQTLADFGNVCINTTAGPNSFILSGNNLDGSNSSTITIAALAGFSYSETSGGTYTPTLSFTYTGNSFTGKEIFVKFSPTAVQSYNGDILINGGSVVNYPVPAKGAGINQPPAVTTNPATSVTATTAVLPGTISFIGCAPVTAYGIEYSPNSGFVEGTGTIVPASNLSGGNFSVSISGLAPNTRYYFKAYATNSLGTTYGAQQAFTNSPLPVVLANEPGLSYTQDFADIATWSNFFITGNGANHFDGLSANATGTIPDGIKLTASTTSFQGATFGSSGGVQRGTDQFVPTTSIVLLSTGSPDNTSSAAIDFYMDFTGVNAGTLSFDWASINNSTGDRAGSMRVYYSVDGLSFTELTFASVLNFVNNSATSGTKANIPLPAVFNNNPNARLRFYYHNGNGGTTGSRPKISIDNLTVTAVATTPCTAPSAPATNLVFGTITDVSIQGSFTAATPASDGYLVIVSSSASLTSNPVDGQIYSLGDNVGDGTVISNGVATSFTATGLSASTPYYFFIFPVNSVCTGGPLYYTTTVLNGTASTVAGLPPCATPAAQPTSLVFGTPTINTIPGSFTAATADGYLVLRSTSASLSQNPANGQVYTSGDIIGNATVVQQSAATTFTATGLNPNTAYYFYIFSVNSANCINGPTYLTTSPLTGTISTPPLPPCVSPVNPATAIQFTATNSAVSVTFTQSADADNYLVVRSTSASLSASPVNNTDYPVGSALGGGTVISNSSGNSVVTNNLVPNTTYYFFVFASNKNCSGGTKYLNNSLNGNVTTSSIAANNYYFGNLHAHSDYSDGNQDNPGYTPADDYLYAMTAQCMDYLGISEHNHFSSPNNPGNMIANYHLGSAQANSFTSSHPNFLALYGMEWGVISGGGHVIVYGDGMDDLFGWESGSGGWGPTNNYDVYVPKSVYTGPTGLFKAINDQVLKNTFATLAHPNLTDYNGIANSAYDAVADNAITGTAVESGPSSSTNTTYSNPGSSMYYLWYYQTMLAKGYHLGPTIDHDNHQTTFGHTTYSRTAVVAPALTKTEIMKSMRNMQFYATQDCDTKVDFSINTRGMGSSFSDRYAPSINVTITDATTNVSNAVIRIMYGVPGSGQMPVKVDSVIGSSLSFSDINLANGATGYYYVDIKNGSTRVVTSPIWYTRVDNNVVPVKLSAFAATRMDSKVKLTWTTQQEQNSKYFVVQHSMDKLRWNTVTTVNASGNSASPTSYFTYDNAPEGGVNYYRLQQVDADGKFEYSEIRSVLFKNDFDVLITPNPATDFIKLYFSKNSTVTQIELYEVNGKLVNKYSTTLSAYQINTSRLAKGMYLVKVNNEGVISTHKVYVQ
ncbi:MAG: hypothetical protein JWQ27_2804 [Ferruginibacter sp.]|nr:hypothetical protein [Ferruginibacter sp.]